MNYKSVDIVCIRILMIKEISVQSKLSSGRELFQRTRYRTRTSTTIRSTDFKSAMSTIPSNGLDK